MKTNAESTLTLFNDCLSQLENRIAEFSANPGKDFTRHRLLDFKTVVKSLMALGGKTLDNELIDLFFDKQHIPSAPAFIQQRNKIDPEALLFLLRIFQRQPTDNQLFNGFRLLAVDGSGLQIADNKDDPDSLHHGIGGKAPFNELFVHGLFDILQQVYVDFSITKLHKSNEPRVFVNMIDRLSSELPVIFLGDMNYSTFNIMAHIHKSHQFFLLRTKDITSNGSASKFILPKSDVFDFSLPDLTLTRLCSAQHCQDKNKLRYLTRDSVFDFLSTRSEENDIPFFKLPLRIVRFKISDNLYETIYTNLDPIAFPLATIKKLYSLRWGIETSFRRLKYTIGMLYTHSKKNVFIFQEIFARVIMFNFVSLCSMAITVKKGKKGYCYTINFSVAANLTRKLFRGLIDLNQFEDNIFRRMNPIRHDKSFDRRKKRRKSFYNFVYRVG